MTIDLEAIEARAKAATPGTWEYDRIACEYLPALLAALRERYAEIERLRRSAATLRKSLEDTQTSTVEWLNAAIQVSADDKRRIAMLEKDTAAAALADDKEPGR